jgi:hypothetical protein
MPTTYDQVAGLRDGVLSLELKSLVGLDLLLLWAPSVQLYFVD